MWRAGRLGAGALVLAVLISASAAATNQMTVATGAGFWPGLWHGLISPISVILSLIVERVDVYAMVNDGGWYDVGFLLGVSIVFGGMTRGARARESRRAAASTSVR